MIEIIILSSDDKSQCPMYKFDNWEMASSFIEFNIKNGYSCEVNGAKDGREN